MTDRYLTDEMLLGRARGFVDNFFPRWGADGPGQA